MSDPNPASTAKPATPLTFDQLVARYDQKAKSVASRKKLVAGLAGHQTKLAAEEAELLTLKAQIQAAAITAAE